MNQIEARQAIEAIASDLPTGLSLTMRDDADYSQVPATFVCWALTEEALKYYDSSTVVGQYVRQVCDTCCHAIATGTAYTGRGIYNLPAGYNWNDKAVIDAISFACHLVSPDVHPSRPIGAMLAVATNIANAAFQAAPMSDKKQAQRACVARLTQKLQDLVDTAPNANTVVV